MGVSEVLKDKKDERADQFQVSSVILCDNIFIWLKKTYYGHIRILRNSQKKVRAIKIASSYQNKDILLSFGVFVATLGKPS